MKLHLPKSLFIAVLASLSISQVHALQLQTIDWANSSYIEIGNTDTISTDGTVSYTASTGVITGIDSSSVYFDVKQDSLSAENSAIIYITTTGEISWGLSTDADGNDITGYWSNTAWTSKGTVSSTVLNDMASEGTIHLKADITTGGTYLYDGDGGKLYHGDTLKTTSGGSVASLTVKSAHVSRVYYELEELDTVTVFNDSKTWSKKYDKTEVYYSNSASDLPSDKKYSATIINSTTLGAESLDYTNIKNCGDIIVGQNGRLLLQTFSRGPISLDNDIYLGSRDDKKAALELREYSGAINLGGMVTLIEDSYIWMEGKKTNTVTFAKGIDGADYTLTTSGLKNTVIAGDVNLKGLVTTLNDGTNSKTNQISFQGSSTQIGLLRVNASTTLSNDGSGSVTITDVELAGGLVIGGSGIVNITGDITTPNSGNRSLEVQKDATLQVGSLNNSWGASFTIDGLLEAQTIKFSSGSTDSLSGSGTVRTDKFIIANWGHYHLTGLRMEIGSGGIVEENDQGYSVHFGDVTIAATESWNIDSGISIFLKDSTEGTTFEVANGKEVSIKGVLQNEDESTKGMLVKSGSGTLRLEGANTYKGGTKVEAGTLIVSQGASLGSGDIDVTGGELQVSGANAITATNLNISNGTVTANYSANDTAAVISHGTTVNIGAGGTLKLTGHDSMGWNGDSRADIILQGGDSNTIAKLDIQDYSGQEKAVCTFSNGIVMKGHAEITGTAFSTYGIEDDIPNGAAGSVQGSRITVEGKNNKITTERLEIRRALELAIAKEAVLTIDSVLFVNSYNDTTADRRITKSGEGTLVITNSANSWNKKLHVTGGTLRLEGAASMPGSVTMASGTRLETGTGTIGSLDMAGGTTLDADTTVKVDGALTLGTGIKLEGAIVNALYSGAEKVTLFSGIDSLSMGGTTYDPSARVAYTPVDITSIFNIENMEEGRYNLYYEGNELFAGLTAAVPEPATATLSLLALAGLCARRRRKA